MKNTSNFYRSFKLVIASLLFLLVAAPVGVANGKSSRNAEIDIDRERARASIAEHNRNLSKLQRARPVQVRVAGNIVVVEASRQNGTMFGPNKFDLSRKSIQLKRSSSGAYDLRATNAPLVNSGEETVRLLQGETKSVPFSFSFPFFRSSFRTMFVYANGNITLGKSGKIPFGLSDFELFHSFARIAPLDFPNLSTPVDVTIGKNSSRVVVTWNIPGNSSPLSFQAILNRTGDIQFSYAQIPSDIFAMTGITPGPANTSLPQHVDFSRSLMTGIQTAIIEKFTASNSVDPVAIAKVFLASQPDTFDFLAYFYRVRHPGRPSFPGTGVDVIYQNNIKGIGRSQYNYARVLGTKGRLKAIASFFDFEAFPGDPRQLFRGYPPELGRTPLWLVSHEIGHYWLASTRIKENGVNTTNLLADGCCHWSFTFDADASFMHGNDIRDNGNGTFTTTDAGTRFSMLDQYLMGLVPASAVGPMFYVANPSGVSPADYGRKNVTFSGTRVDVSMNQIIAAEGPRIPSSNSSQRSFNVGFVFVVDQGRLPTQAELAKLDRLRTTWESFFEQAAGNRIQINTGLSNHKDPMND